MRFVLAINILHEEMMAVLRAESCELRAPSFEQTLADCSKPATRGSRLAAPKPALDATFRWTSGISGLEWFRTASPSIDPRGRTREREQGPSSRFGCISLLFL